MKIKVCNFLKYIILYLTIGIVIGVSVGLYQYLSQKIIELSNYLFTNINVTTILIVVFSILILSPISFYIIKYNPDLDGSGVPYLIRQIDEKEDIHSKLSIVFIYINSFITSFFGFPLGLEGPSIVISGKISCLIQNIFKKNIDYDLVSISASAGFGCAFLSPLAGITYYFESHPKSIKNIKLLITSLFINIAAFTFTYLINKHHLLQLLNFPNLDFNYIYIFLILIILNLISAAIFVNLTIKLRYLVKKYNSNFFVKYRSFLLFIIIVILNYYLFNYMGAGSKIKSLYFINLPIIYLLGILLFRIIVTSISSNGNVSGGLVIPSMTLGTIIGQITCLFLNKFFNLNPDNFELIILVSMTLSFAIINKNPLSASILVINAIFNLTFNILNVLIIFPLVIVFFYLASYLATLMDFSNLYKKMNDVSKLKI